MHTVSEHIRKGLHDRLGIHAEEPVNAFVGDLRRSEWSVEFEKHMRDHLVMGAIRYGRINAPGKPRFNRVEEVRNRVLKYEVSGNTEFLVDVANMALLEFEEGQHPTKHYKAIDDGEHSKIKR